MKKKISLSIILILILSLKVIACTCVGKDSVKQAVRNTNVILVGFIVGSDTLTINTSIKNQTLKLLKYTVIVEEVIKGKVKSDTIMIVTGLGSGDCGFKFTIGNRYIIYSNWKRKYYSNQSKKVSRYLSTDICSRTCSYSEKEIKQIKNTRKYCFIF